MPAGKETRLFSPQARQAAIEKRRRVREEQPPKGTPSLFVVRLAVDHQFGWEIRRFGSIVLSRSDDGFATRSEAQVAGQEALATMLS